MTETLQSPLTEVPKDSLAELFQKDPLTLTKADIGIICDELRKQRDKWQKDEVIKANKPAKAKVTMSAKEMDDLLAGLGE